MSLVLLAADTSALQPAMRKLAERGPIAARRALNKARASGITHATRLIASDLQLRGGQAPVRKAMGGRPATETDLRAELRITGTWIAAIKAPGVSVDRGRLAKSRVGVSPAFLAKMSNGKRGYFQRIAERGRRGKRYLQRIAEIFIPPLPQLIRERALNRSIAAFLKTILQRKLEQETKFILRGRAS